MMCYLSGSHESLKGSSEASPAHVGLAQTLPTMPATKTIGIKMGNMPKHNKNMSIQPIVFKTNMINS